MATPTLIVGDFNTDPVDTPRLKVTTVPAILASKELHPPLRSAYPLPRKCDEAFTTWKVRGASAVKHVIDFIFHNGNNGTDRESSSNGVSEDAPNGLRLTDTLAVPVDADVEPTRLPGFRYPSDHVMIAARFELVAELVEE